MSFTIKHIDLSNCNGNWCEVLFAKNVYAVFWWKQIALAHLYVNDTETINGKNFLQVIWKNIAATVLHYNDSEDISAIETKFLLNDFSLLENIFKKFEKVSLENLPKVSLIICTRNRPEQLENCLRSLSALSYKPTEIIVVDNASTNNNTKPVVEKFQNIKYVFAKNIGLDFARNAGIKNAVCEIVAFTDDDVELHQDWVLRIAKSFDDKKIKAVAGLIFAKELETDAQVIFEKYWSFNRGYVQKKYGNDFFKKHQHDGLPVYTIGAGASMAFKKNIFDALGGFDVRLDMGAAGCNGDSEMWYRIIAEGWEVKYDPLIISYHTHRREIKQLKTQLFLYMRGFVVASLIEYNRYKVRGEHYYLYKHLPKYYFKKIIAAIGKGFKKESITIISEIKGFAAGFFYYYKSKRNKPFELDFEKPFIDERKIEDKPLVSIIITAYNHAQYLSDAIESALQQTYSNIEIIVVDDGSVDDPESVVAKYKSVKYFYQSNKGLAAARNAGAFISNCDYILFLDADDWLYPQAIEKNLEQFKLNNGIAFVSGWYDLVNTYKEILTPYLLPPPKDNFYPALLKSNYIGMHATVLYSKPLFDNFLYDVNLKACEDYDLYLRIARLYKISSHNERITAYRMHDTNMSNNILMMVKNVEHVLKKHYATLPVAGKYDLYAEGIGNWKTYYADEILLRLQYASKYPYYKSNFKDSFFSFRILPFRFLKITLKNMFSAMKNAIRKILPPFAKRYLFNKRLINYYIPKTGKVKLGDLNRKTPISKEFGYDRGGPVDRYYIENFLSSNSGLIQGNVLEIGDNDYTVRFGKDKVIKSDILYIDDSNINATIIGDLSNLQNVHDEQFDCIVLTQTLHLIYDFKAALKTCARILKKGGTLLITVPGITNIDYGEWEKTWYWSFTGRSIQLLLEEAFDTQNIKVHTYGNVLAATAFLQGLGAEEIKKEDKDYHDPHYPLIIASVAVKT